MGPLVPDIISNEFNLIVAFIVGIGFGYVLEQAGFASTRKLVGLFYGYDFTVLRVFFTAGVTALVGVLLLTHFNMLNLDIIYINPTFLWAALIGGGIMGAGFIIGGFCPGTSVCAAAAGRIDAMFFILGSFIGVFAFTELYPYFKDLYYAENWGAVRIDQYFEITSEMFAVILTLIAVGAFTAVRLVENKVNKIDSTFDKIKFRKRAALAALPVALILFTASVPSLQEIAKENVEEKILNPNYSYNEISLDKLLSELANKNNQYNLIDVRSKEDYDKGHIPLAINIPLEDINDYAWEDYFKQQFKTNIFYAGDLDDAKRAYLYSDYIGSSKKLLFTSNHADYLNLTTKNEKANLESAWRSETHQKLIDLEKYLSKFSAPVKKKEIKIQGGCT
jgi:rhodanese-related sulfurtransferase